MLQSQKRAGSCSSRGFLRLPEHKPAARAPKALQTDGLPGSQGVRQHSELPPAALRGGDGRHPAASPARPRCAGGNRRPRGRVAGAPLPAASDEPRQKPRRELGFSGEPIASLPTRRSRAERGVDARGNGEGAARLWLFDGYGQLSCGHHLGRKSFQASS